MGAPCSTRLTSSESATAHVWLAVPSFGLTVIELELTASTVPRTTRCTLGRTGFCDLQLVCLAITAALAPLPEPIVPLTSPPVFENAPAKLPKREPSPRPALPRSQPSSVPSTLSVRVSTLAAVGADSVALTWLTSPDLR